jgi:hypothetical protein
MDVFTVFAVKALLFLVQAANLANWDSHCFPGFLLE